MILAMPSAGVLTGQLRAYAHGHSEAAEFILRETRPQLRQIAVWKLSKSRFARLSTPTDLIHDTWITRLHGGRWQVQNREHFFCLVGRAMEQVLIDMARKRMAQRRGNGAIHESLDNVKWSCQPRSADAEQILAIQLLLEKLAKQTHSLPRSSGRITLPVTAWRRLRKRRD